MKEIKAETNEIDFAHSKNVESPETVLIRLRNSWTKMKNNQKMKKKKNKKKKQKKEKI